MREFGSGDAVAAGPGDLFQRAFLEVKIKSHWREEATYSLFQLVPAHTPNPLICGAVRSSPPLVPDAGITLASTPTRVLLGPCGKPSRNKSARGTPGHADPRQEGAGGPEEHPKAQGGVPVPETRPVARPGGSGAEIRPKCRTHPAVEGQKPALAHGTGGSEEP
jgi:hypothetical protein